MVEKFEPNKGEPKVNMSATINESLDKMIEEVSSKFNFSYSRALNEILKQFKEDHWFDVDKTENTEEVVKE